MYMHGTGSPFRPQVLTGCFVLTRGKEWMYTNDSRLLAAGPSWFSRKFEGWFTTWWSWHGYWTWPFKVDLPELPSWHYCYYCCCYYYYQKCFTITITLFLLFSNKNDTSSYDSYEAYVFWSTPPLPAPVRSGRAVASGDPGESGGSQGLSLLQQLRQGGDGSSI